MAKRTQISLRIDSNLLGAIRAKCAAENLTQTEFITNAIKAALDIPLAPTNVAEIDTRISTQIEPIREELARLRAALGELVA
ncbi:MULTISPECIES: hypothetical protein [unclassified Coleofasciculus]|uniref:hypothetical protein n=1 Tax=unclassified Coleofasciculus TaxID=2692782 RepID=UPI00188145EF|nr:MULTISPECIES: hypothetical protein [unclassified Coleofasciculus]MBE9128871.1 hypothetical protein [Coleofasciculus sp. LEGE 07081]MBE9151592.1 hypothetical protein [Coleofasciculus sp. LEGE 07092]